MRKHWIRTTYFPYITRLYRPKDGQEYPKMLWHAKHKQWCFIYPVAVKTENGKWAYGERLYLASDFLEGGNCGFYTRARAQEKVDLLNKMEHE